MKQTQKVLLVLIGQFISQLGGALTGFAFGIMLFKLDNRVSDLSLLYFYQLLPMIIFMLPAGIIVDKFKKKNLAIICQVCSIVLLSWIFYCYYHQHLTKLHLYCYVALSAIFATLEGLATTALIGKNIPDLQKTTFNIFLNLRQIIPRLVAPVFAGYWVMYGNNNLLLTLDLLSSIFCLFTSLQLGEEIIADKKQKFVVTVQEYKLLFAQIGSQLPLLWSLVCISISICTISLMGVYFLPIMLQLSTPATSGNLIALGGAGAILAGWLVTLLPQQKKIIANFIPLSLALQGLVLILGLFSFHFYFIGLILFIYYLLNPWQRGYSYTLWETTIDKDLYGKAFAIKSLILQVASAVMLLIAGPLVDDFLIPLFKNKHYIYKFPMMPISNDSIAAMMLVLVGMGMLQFILGFYIFFRQKISFQSEI